MIVATTPRHRTADELFSEYKRQIYNEHANHVFKGPLAVSPVFLKTPERVEALAFLMMISLMLHFLLQREYRRGPADAQPKERRVTTQTLLRWFANYTVLISRGCHSVFGVPPGTSSLPAMLPRTRTILTMCTADASRIDVRKGAQR